MPRDRRVLGPRETKKASRSESPSKANAALGVKAGTKVDPNTGRIVDDHSVKSSSSKSSSRREKSREKKPKKDKNDRRPERSPSKDRDSDGGAKGSGGATQSFEATVYQILPKFKEVEAKERPELLTRKLHACNFVWDFKHQELHNIEKEGKRQTLVEMLDYINNTDGSFTWTETMLNDALEMVGYNIFRPLVKRERTPMDILDPEDEEPVLEPMWPHLELVYDFALRTVSSKDLDSNTVCKYVNHRFITRLVDLFDSDDPRERDSLKLLMNKIYGRVSSLRSTIRRCIQVACQRAVSDTNEGGGIQAQNGFSELLEILARIIGNFSMPLKEESRALLVNVLLPLLKVEWLGMFHPQLSECIKKFLEKDNKLTYEVLLVLLRHWPFSSASKQVLFLSELETCLLHSNMPVKEFKRVQDVLARRLALCLCSPHSDVAERSLGLWKSDRFVKLLTQNCREQFPGIISALYDNFTQHWHSSVHNRTLEVLKMLMETDPELFDTSSTRHRKIVEAKEKQQAERDRRWGVLQALHDRRKSNPNVQLAPKQRRKQSPAAATTQSKHDPIDEGAKSALVRKSASREKIEDNAIPLTRERYGVAITWDCGGCEVDIGIQALVVDTKGRVIDAVHELCPTALQAMIYRREDRPSVNARTECGGMIWFALSRIPEQVAFIAFVAHALGEGNLRDTSGSGLHVVEESTINEFAHFTHERLNGNAGVVAVVRRSAEKTWKLCRLEEFAKFGRHYMDILDPTLSKVTREVLPSVPKRQRAALAFTPKLPGSVYCLPTASVAKWLFIGLGWDLTPSESTNVGLTLSAVFFDAQTRHLGAAAPDSLEVFGAKHGGPGLLSQGVILDLDAAPDEAAQIFIVGHLATKQSTHELIQCPTMSIIDPLGSELLTFKPTVVSKDGPCLLLGRIFRTDGCWSSAGGGSMDQTSHWAFQMLGKQCSGLSWQDSLVDLRSYCERPLAAFQRLPVDVHTGGNCTVSL